MTLVSPSSLNHYWGVFLRKINSMKMPYQVEQQRDEQHAQDLLAPCRRHGRRLGRHGTDGKAQGLAKRVGRARVVGTMCGGGATSSERRQLKACSGQARCRCRRPYCASRRFAVEELVLRCDAMLCGAVLRLKSMRGPCESNQSDRGSDRNRMKWLVRSSIMSARGLCGSAST